jgi:hypothetical protein
LELMMMLKTLELLLEMLKQDSDKKCLLTLDNKLLTLLHQETILFQTLEFHLKFFILKTTSKTLRNNSVEN